MTPVQHTDTQNHLQGEQNLSSVWKTEIKALEGPARAYVLRAHWMGFFSYFVAFLDTNWD